MSNSGLFGFLTAIFLISTIILGVAGIMIENKYIERLDQACTHIFGENVEFHYKKDYFACTSSEPLEIEPEKTIWIIEP